MASKQVKRCRTLQVIKKRLIEIRDIILPPGEDGWQHGSVHMQVQLQVGPSPLTPGARTNPHIVGA